VVHLGAETSPALLSGARERADDDIHTAAAGVDDLATDRTHPTTNTVAIDRAPDGARNDEAEPGGTLVLTLEAVIDG
jgi:hypothetical protein